MSNDKQGSRPNVNPGVGTPPPGEDEAREQAMVDKLSLKDSADTISESDLSGADLNSLVSEEQNPFAGYVLAPEVKMGGFHASKTFLVFYKGRLPSDPLMQGKKVEHIRSLRLNGGRVAVVFNRQVKGVKYPVAVIPEAELRAQLLFYRDQGALKEDDNYQVADSDQIPLLYQLFRQISPGENALVKQMMGDE